MWTYIIAGLIALASLATISVEVKSYLEEVKDSGRKETQVKWDAANKAATEKEAKRLADADLTAKTSAGLLAAAQQKADSAEDKWRKDRAKPTPLAGCVKTPATRTSDTGKPEPQHLALRFSAGFLRDWNSGWTGDSGQPLFPDSPPAASYPDDTLTSIGPGEVLDRQHADAKACSTNARNLNSLIDQIEKLRAGWK